MPLRLEIKKLLASRSERVKSCDLHPTEPWVLSALYTGHLFVWNYNTQSVVKSIEVSDQPIRCAKFITRKQWVICGSDDMVIRVFNLNTMEKIASFEGHLDYIRSLDVHPTQPYVLSSSDDMQIKLWNWEANWQCTQTFEGHAHYVMQVKWNPKDGNTFASASLDKSVKVWSIGSPLPNFSLEGHERGVNALDFYPGGDKPYLVSGADDRTLKIWDYQTKSCVQTLDGHTTNVSAVCFHPKLPVILSGSEDGTVRMWHSTTYRLETTLNYALERCWTIAVTPESNKVAVGYDEGTIVLALGQDKPVASIDTAGKVLLANNNDIVSCALRNVTASEGDRVEVQTKDLGSCEVFPQKLMHNSNGRFVAVCGDGEYIIYTAQALRNKSFGSALDFAWSADGTGDYAVRESSSRVRLFKNFKESKVFKPPFSAEGLYGGNLVALTGSEYVVFYDWTDCNLVMRIDVSPREVYWSADGEFVVLACEESYYVLRCDLNAISEAIANGTANPDEGISDSFELLYEISETVESGQWVGGCFLYTNTAGRLNYCVGGEVMTLTHLDRQMFLMGFVARENRVFLIDKNRQIVSFTLLESVLQYQTAVVRQDFDLANQLLATIPREKYNDISRFLESQGYKEVALQVADDPDQKFELALQLEKLEVALEIMQKEIVPNSAPDDLDTQSRWKQLGDLALARGNLRLAEECAKNAADFSGLLLMYTSAGNSPGVRSLFEQAQAAGRSNIAFICSLLLGDKSACIDILHKSNRNAEAAFFARTYAPSAADACVAKWKEDLGQVNTRAAKALAAPGANPELFPESVDAIQAEQLAERFAGEAPATAYLSAIANADVVLTELLREQGEGAVEALFSSHSAPTPGSPPAAPFGGPRDAELAQRAHDAEMEALAREQAEADKLARAQAEADAQLEFDAAARAEAEAQALAQAQAEAEAEAHAQAQAQAEAEAQAQAEAQARAEEQARAQAQAEAEAEAAEQARLQAEAEATARAQAEAEAAAAARLQQEELLRQQQEEAELLRREDAEALAAADAAAEAQAAAQQRAVDDDELDNDLASGDLNSADGADAMLEAGMDDDLEADFEDWS